MEEEPIVVWLNAQDQINLAIIESTGLTREEAIRTALTSLAADCTPVVLALNGSLPAPRRS